MVKKTKKIKKKLVDINPSPKKKVRLVDIANQFNLAVSTVSRILNGSPEKIKASKKQESWFWMQLWSLGI